MSTLLSLEGNLSRLYKKRSLKPNHNVLQLSSIGKIKNPNKENKHSAKYDIQYSATQFLVFNKCAAKIPPTIHWMLLFKMFTIVNTPSFFLLFQVNLCSPKLQIFQSEWEIYGCLVSFVFQKSFVWMSTNIVRRCSTRNVHMCIQQLPNKKLESPVANCPDCLNHSGQSDILISIYLLCFFVKRLHVTCAALPEK